MNTKADLFQKMQAQYGRGMALTLAGLILLLVLALFTWMNYRIAGGGKWEVSDFTFTWLGGKAIIEGVDLYDPAAWEEVHVRYAGNYRDNPVFLYLPPAAYLFIPFALLPVRWGAALWLLVSEIGLVFSVGFLARDLKSVRSPVKAAAFAVAVAMFSPIMIVIWSGQYSVVMLFFLVLIYALLSRNKDLAAGIWFPFLLLRLSPVLAIIPALFALALWQRRWKFLLASACSCILLFGASWWIHPGYLKAISSYSVESGGKLYTYFSITPTLWGLVFNLGRALPGPVNFLISLSLALAICAVAAVWFISTKGASLGSVIALATSISLFITPYAWNYDQILLLFPLLYVLHLAERGRKDLKRWAWLGVILLLDIAPYFLRFVAMIRHQDTLSALLPFALFLLVLWATAVFPEPRTTASQPLNLVRLDGLQPQGLVD